MNKSKVLPIDKKTLGFIIFLNCIRGLFLCGLNPLNTFNTFVAVELLVCLLAQAVYSAAAYFTVGTHDVLFFIVAFNPFLPFTDGFLFMAQLSVLLLATALAYYCIQFIWARILVICIAAAIGFLGYYYSFSTIGFLCVLIFLLTFKYNDSRRYLGLFSAISAAAGFVAALASQKKFLDFVKNVILIQRRDYKNYDSISLVIIAICACMFIVFGIYANKTKRQYQSNPFFSNNLSKNETATSSYTHLSVPLIAFSVLMELIGVRIQQHGALPWLIVEPAYIIALLARENDGNARRVLYTLEKIYASRFVMCMLVFVFYFLCAFLLNRRNDLYYATSCYR